MKYLPGAPEQISIRARVPASHSFLIVAIEAAGQSILLAVNKHFVYKCMLNAPASV